MGRTLKRVPMDFDWPLNKLWSGYVMDCGGPCPEENKTCFNGYTASGKWLEALCSLIAMAGQQAGEPEELRNRPWIRYPHPYLYFEQAPTYDVPRDIRLIENKDERNRTLHLWLRDNENKLLPLTSDLHSFVENLADEKIDGMARTSSAGYRIANRLKEFLGYDKSWGICSVCDGKADDPSKREAVEAWEPTHPPEGEGFQLWETTSEGSPQSPVFASLDELCQWCAENATTFANFKASAEDWKAMLSGDNVHHR